MNPFTRFPNLLDRQTRPQIHPQIRRWLYPGLFTIAFLLSSSLVPHLAYSLSPETICQTELNGNSVGNRSLEILEQCRNQNPIQNVDRGEIQRRLALMYYDRLGATGRDRLGALPRSQKIEALERQVNDSIEIAKTAGDDALLNRCNYTLGQIRMNEIDLSVRLLNESETSEITTFQTQIQNALQPLVASNQVQSKLYQARLFTIALPIFYRAVDRQTQAFDKRQIQYESDLRKAQNDSLPLPRPPEKSATFDRLSQNTQMWTTNLLQLLPQIQSQLQPQPSAQTPSQPTTQPTHSESVALAIYHANTLSKTEPVRQAANQLETRRQTAERARQKRLNQKPTAGKPSVALGTTPIAIKPAQPYQSFLPMGVQTQLALESDRADRQAAELLANAIRSSRHLSTSSAPDAQADVQALRRNSLQATQALARLYEKQKQPDIAASLLTPDVLLEADSVDSPELAGLLYGRYARLQFDRLSCKTPTAANALNCQAARQVSDTAIRRIEMVRGDLLSLSPDLQYSYREGVEPLYRDNIELQLAQPNPNLEDVLTRMESLKLAEVHNYFREPCVETKVQLNRFINQTLPDTNLIYTLVMDDRLEVIVKLASTSGSPSNLRRYQSNVPRKTLEKAIATFRQNVIDGNPSSAPSKALYNWIFRSKDSAGRTLETDLRRDTTIVMVSDSGLREIPMAALFDGKEFVIDRFAVALSPGLTLFDPKPVKAPNVMFAGQTKFDRTIGSSLPGIKVELTDLQKNKLLPLQSPSNQVLFSDPESPYLPFTLQNFEASVSRQGFNVVHLATHANFSSQQEQTFIVMGDERVGTEAFSEALRKRDRNREDSIELLILSACKTAEGDDRAVLGLAGLALRSGARSTLASLWTASDALEVTPTVLREFYQSVFTRKLSKAQALRQAQLKLKQNKPSSYWAPYVVVGNWL